MLKKIRHKLGFWLLKDLPKSTFRIYGLDRHADDDISYEFINFHKVVQVEFDYPDWVYERESKHEK